MRAFHSSTLASCRRRCDSKTQQIRFDCSFHLSPAFHRPKWPQTWVFAQSRAFDRNDLRSFARLQIVKALTFFALILLSASAMPLSAAEPRPAFVDITEESGIRAAIERHYQKYSNWWMSGLNLVDLDGD